MKLPHVPRTHVRMPRTSRHGGHAAVAVLPAEVLPAEVPPVGGRPVATHPAATRPAATCPVVTHPAATHPPADVLPPGVARQPRFTPHAAARLTSTMATPVTATRTTRPIAIGQRPLVPPTVTAPLSPPRPAPPSASRAHVPPDQAYAPSRRPGGGRYEITTRAIIGDELRIPVLWCQFGSCVNRYTDSGALGERDLRYRAVASGWRFDALGRLACPSCLQRDASFWPTRPPAVIARPSVAATRTSVMVPRPSAAVTRPPAVVTQSPVAVPDSPTTG